MGDERASGEIECEQDSRGADSESLSTGASIMICSAVRSTLDAVRYTYLVTVQC